MRYHADERRAFYGDIFANHDGDTNLVYLNPHIPIAWHRHQKQSDRLFLVSGILRVRIWETNPRVDGVEHLLVDTPGARDVLYIPAGWWHGYESLAPHTVVLQFNGPGKWDNGKDEERLSLDQEPWEWDAQ